MIKTVSALLLCALAVLSKPVWSQSLASVSGTVTDEDGDPLPFVKVFLAQQEAQGTSSDGNGEYRLSGIRPGDYFLSVSKVGFKQRQIPVSLASNENARVDIALAPSTYHLDEVVVYGQKRSTVSALRLNAPLEKTPVTVNIVPRELLDQQQAISLEDALRNVGGVSKFGSYGISDNINIRGFDIGLAGGPENYRLNGVMLRTPYSDYVEEVQVLKGPSSILYGDVEPGGIINFVTKKPLGYRHGTFEMKVGQDSLYRPSVDIGAPVGNDVAVRLNAVYESSDSFRDDVESEQSMLAPSVLWNLSERTSVLVEALYMDNETTIDWGMPVFLPLERAEQLDPTNFYGYPGGTSEGETRLFSATLNHRFSDTWSIRNIFAYSDQERLLHDVYPIYNADDDNVVYSFGDYRELSETETISNFLDVYGDFETGTLSHRVTLSFDYSRIERPVGFNFVFPIEGSTSLTDPTWTDVPLSAVPELDGAETPFTRRIGISVQDLISLLDGRLNVLVGGRYSEFTTGTDLSGGDQSSGGEEDRTESEFTPRVGFTYEVVDGSTIYFSYAESFSSVTPAPGRGLSDPEPLIGDQIEIGLKQSLFDDRLGITLSYFDITRENVLQFDIVDPNGSISDPDNFRANQSGEHASEGVEIEVNGKLSDNWQVFASVSYMETEVIEEVVQSGGSEPVDYAGFELPNNPNTKFSLWTQYTLDRGVPGLSAALGVFYQDEMYGDRLNTSANTIDSFTRVDAMLGYEYKNVRLRLNVQNLNDAETFQRSIFGSFVPQMDRRVIASIAYDF